MELKEIIKKAFIISENATFAEALDLMLNNHTNTLLVVNDEGELSGEVSVSDLFDGIIPLSFDADQALEHLQNEEVFAKTVQEAKDTPVSDFMSADYTTVHPNDSIMDIASVAITHQRARIPVVDHDNHPIGIISRQGLKQILGKYLKNKN
ncbi:MAG: CBS domain-containing protein [Acidimicrobiales bacterium]|jgi:CBS domain-containing protein